MSLLQRTDSHVFSVNGVEVFDQSALSLEAKEEMYKLYPNARRAHLKTGGNFPYLCRSAEVNLYIQVRSFTDKFVLQPAEGDRLMLQLGDFSQ